MGLSSLDCPICGGWDEGYYNYPKGLVEMPDGKKYKFVCKKCLKDLKELGGRQFHYTNKDVKVYDD